jgi:hypothetical protein
MAEPTKPEPGIALAWIEQDVGEHIELPAADLGARKGLTVKQVLECARDLGRVPLPVVEAALCGKLGLALHGVRCTLDDPVEFGDRIEMVGALLADAKSARRERVLAARARRTRDKWRPNWRA